MDILERKGQTEMEKRYMQMCDVLEILTLAILRILKEDIMKLEDVSDIGKFLFREESKLSPAKTYLYAFCVHVGCPFFYMQALVSAGRSVEFLGAMTTWRSEMYLGNHTNYEKFVLFQGRQLIDPAFKPYLDIFLSTFLHRSRSCSLYCHGADDVCEKVCLFLSYSVRL